MRMLALGCLAGLCFCLVACEGEKKSAGAAAQIPPPLVTALTLERADVPIYAVFMGQTVGRHSAAVKPQVTGKIGRAHV